MAVTYPFRHVAVDLIIKLNIGFVLCVITEGTAARLPDEQADRGNERIPEAARRTGGTEE